MIMTVRGIISKIKLIENKKNITKSVEGVIYPDLFKRSKDTAEKIMIEINEIEMAIFNRLSVFKTSSLLFFMQLPPN
jgi:hypothetical protein